MPKAITIDEFRKNISTLKDGENFEVLRIAEIDELPERYKKHKSRCFVVFHKECKNTFITTNISMMKSVYHCPYCVYKKRSENSLEPNKEKFLTFFNSELAGEYTLLSEYTKDKEKVKLRHNCEKCGNYEFMMLPYNLKSQR